MVNTLYAMYKELLLLLILTQNLIALLRNPLLWHGSKEHLDVLHS